ASLSGVPQPGAPRTGTGRGRFEVHGGRRPGGGAQLVDKMMYLAELRQLASVAHNFENYMRVVERIERVCDSIEHDIGLSQPGVEEDAQLYQCLGCGSTWRSRAILDGSVHGDCGGLVSRVRD